MTRASQRGVCAFLIGCVVSASLPRVHADEEQTKVRVTTFLLDHKDVDDALLVPAMRQLDDALRRNPRLEMKDLDTRLADFAQEVPSSEIDQGRQQLADGEKALHDRELGTAIKTLRAAVDTLAKVLPFIKKQELAESMEALGVALCESGDKKAGRAQFGKLLVWRSDHKYDITKFPDRDLGIFEEVKKEIERSRRGMLEIHSDPGSAQAYVDGRYIGVTPATAEGLIAGDHFVTLKKEGFRKSVQSATVSTKVLSTVDVKLERSAKYLLVEEAMRATERELGHDTLDTEVDNLKEMLFLDQAVFVRAARVSPTKVRVETYLYDLRTHKRLSAEKHDMADGDIEKKLAAQASALYMNVSYDAELVAPKDDPLPQSRGKHRPVYKKWWFWTVIGVAAVGVGVTAGLLVEKFKPQSCPPGEICPQFTF